MERSTNEFEYFGDDDDWFYSGFHLFDDFTDTNQLPSPNSSTPRVRPTANASSTVTRSPQLQVSCQFETEQNLVSVNINTIMESNAPAQSSKVAVVTTDEVDQFIKGQKAKHTSYKDTSDMKKFKDFCENIGESRDIDDIPAPELNSLLCAFFMKVKRKDGKEYEPSSLSSFLNTFTRVLADKGSKINLKKDTEFEKTRKVLAARRKQLTKQGYGNKPNAARTLEPEEIRKLHETGYFGAENAEALQRTIWWNVSLHFGFRARDESRKLKWGDVKVDKDAKGHEMLVWNKERGTKTRTGEKAQADKRKFPPIATATDSSRCPVTLFKMFECHRSDAMKQPGSPFFLAIKRNLTPVDAIWYYDSPLGKNKIGEILTKARSILDSNQSAGKISNHSVRKTTVTRLLDNDVDPIFASQLTGHKRLESLNSYYRASKVQQQQMSNILSMGDDEPPAKRRA